MEQISFFITDFVEGIADLYNSTFFLVVKFLIGIYVIILIANIILMLVQRGLSGDVSDTVLGMNVPRELVTKKGRKYLRGKWGKIKNRLESGKVAQYKVAVIEADGLIDNLIRRMGYAGENLGERLENIPPGQVEDAPKIKEAHEIRNRVVRDEKFELTREEARRAFGLYEEFLRTHEVLD